MTFDKDALNFAADLALDDVLHDPSNDEIVLAVEEYMFGPGSTRRVSSRLRDGILAVYLRLSNNVGEDRERTVRWAQNHYGLC